MDLVAKTKTEYLFWLPIYSTSSLMWVHFADAPLASDHGRITPFTRSDNYGLSSGLVYII